MQLRRAGFALAVQAPADAADEPIEVMGRVAGSAMIALGAEVYATNCASCHGAELEGQPN